MSSSLFGILNTGRQGLFAQQTSLSVTGNNIANINTEGYSRQRVQIEALSTGGARVMGVERLKDDFLVARYRESIARLGGRSTLALNMRQIETTLGDTNSAGLNDALRNFIDAMQDLTQQPGGTPERDALRAQGRSLSATFNSLSNQVTLIRDQIDTQLTGAVSKVNNLTASIASLNSRIAEFRQSSQSSEQRPDLNNLLDQRDKQLDQLAEYMSVKTVSSESGELTVIAGGQVLVQGKYASQLGLQINPSNNNYLEVTMADVAGKPISITSSLTEGSLGAMVRSRDQYAGTAVQTIERLAAKLTRDFNVQHRAGTGLDGIAGRDFFSGLAVTANGQWNNKGGASVSSAQVLNDAALTFDDFEIRFTAANTYSILNKTSGATLSAGNAYVSGGNIDFGGMRVVIDNGSGTPQSGDTFSVNSYAGTPGRMALTAAVEADNRMIATGLSGAAGDNRNALALASLLTSNTMGNPASLTYEGYFENLRLNIGMTTATAESNEDDETISQQQIKGLETAVSGVSLDEEATNIIQFQRAFEASGRVIRMTDELLQTILQMI